ncbi:hypothetical protein D3C87_1402600 [compost metagenome]
MRKAILDYPAEVGFRNYRPGILAAETRRHTLAVSCGGGGHDAVHHDAGAGEIFRDEGSEIIIGETSHLHQKTVQDATVGRKIVAGEQSQRHSPGGPPASCRFHQKTKRGARLLRMRQIMNDIGMVTKKRARRQIGEVTLFRDRQSDDSDPRISHGLQQPLRIFRSNDGLED